MITGKSSRWGATLDATADRIAEAFWIGAFIAVGVSVQSALIIWIAAATQEYVRARAGGLGMRSALLSLHIISICYGRQELVL
jgi:phosphatidylglycerophosphate synthase